MSTTSRTRNPKAGATAVPAATELALINVLWATRLERAGELTQVITAQDVAEMDKCMAYLKADPSLLIHSRPDGGMVVSVVQRGTTDTIRAVESDMERFEAAERAAGAKAAKEQGRAIATRLRAETEAGIFSSATIDEVCAALAALSA